MISRTANRKPIPTLGAIPPPPNVPALDPKSMLASLREVVRRAWQTLSVLRDPDLHFFRRGGWLFFVIRDM
ncbi:MAG: hypothetical protein JO124_01010, partial [Hyphomicrobiales bacterium]|nr:hypothetical protein [Hyphomicrobiales bacterium]